ncbi:VOC family protein [Spirosoma sp. BT702]|uniref:Bleomycin resistance protein n=1 Tax=Spirosoma profusum TaxID=2771354 RepID=A0A926XZM6_9BACT|nr:VOC family protein [Spirosoma profusum]MBD2701177.1 VOC family protein [Spirosoma profusum]
MKLIPLFKCRDMPEAVTFYTRILDFSVKYPQATANDWVIDLVNGVAELQLTVLESDTLFGSVANIRVLDVDALFQYYVARGLDTSSKENSPVHQGPIDQSWGTREFYVTDSDGNTLRFCQPITT